MPLPLWISQDIFRSTDCRFRHMLSARRGKPLLIHFFLPSFFFSLSAGHRGVSREQHAAAAAAAAGFRGELPHAATFITSFLSQFTLALLALASYLPPTTPPHPPPPFEYGYAPPFFSLYPLLIDTEKTKKLH